MAVSLQSFARQLKSEKVPHYAYPKFEPTEVFERYKFGIISCTRTINSTGSPRTTRQKEVLRVDRSVQQRIWNKLVKPTESINPYVVAISSSVNDYLAHEVAATLLLAILRNFKGRIRPTWKWVTTRFDPNLTNNERQNIVFIRSVLPQEGRSYNVRDILDYYYNSLRIVVLGGINGIDYFDNYLHHPLNGALHVEGYKGNAPKEFWVKDDKGEVLDNEDFKYPVFTLDAEGRTILEKLRVGS